MKIEVFFLKFEVLCITSNFYIVKNVDLEFFFKVGSKV